MIETDSAKAIDELHQRLNKEAEAGGYHLNPNAPFARELVAGLLVNEKRYGYRACPCRLASGVQQEDRDIVCPCDYRDTDLTECGACYCGLYVSTAVQQGAQPCASIPERRPCVDDQALPQSPPAATNQGTVAPKLAYPVWRCPVCGYLCARDGPPEMCPICKVKKDRFERFM